MTHVVGDPYNSCGKFVFDWGQRLSSQNHDFISSYNFESCLQGFIHRITYSIQQCPWGRSTIFFKSHVLYLFQRNFSVQTFISVIKMPKKSIYFKWIKLSTFLKIFKGNGTITKTEMAQSFTLLRCENFVLTWAYSQCTIHRSTDSLVFSLFQFEYKLSDMVYELSPWTSHCTDKH